MPFVTSDDVRAEQEVLAERVHKLQEALDHAVAIDRVLAADEHQLRHYLSDLSAGLASARDASATRIRFNEGLLVRVEREEAAGVR